MKIGIIGAGNIAQAFAKQALKAKIEVVLSNSRGPESLKPLIRELGEGASAGSIQEAAAQDIVLVAVPWRSLPLALSGLSAWNQRIVIDATNPIQAPDFKVADLEGKTSSELVARLVPGARVVKALNTLPPETLAADPKISGQRIQFISGDDQQAKNTVTRILEKIGFGVIDLGGLASGGQLYQFPGGPLAAQNLVRRPLRE